MVKHLLSDANKIQEAKLHYNEVSDDYADELFHAFETVIEKHASKSPPTNKAKQK